LVGIACGQNLAQIIQNSVPSKQVIGTLRIFRNGRQLRKIDMDSGPLKAHYDFPECDSRTTKLDSG